MTADCILSTRMDAGNVWRWMCGNHDCGTAENLGLETGADQRSMRICVRGKNLHTRWACLLRKPQRIHEVAGIMQQSRAFGLGTAHRP